MNDSSEALHAPTTPTGALRRVWQAGAPLPRFEDMGALQPLLSVAPEPSAGCLWDDIRHDAAAAAKGEPLLAAFLHDQIMQHDSLEAAVSHVVAAKLENGQLHVDMLRTLMHEAMRHDVRIVRSVREDILAVCDRDPACSGAADPLLYYKGLHALIAYRTAHWLWTGGRRKLARCLQSRIAERFGVDIHPAARIGYGILLDHAHGFVMGETAVIEDNVSILHNVTLGGTGKETGDRHPKVRSGVLIGAGALILGNIEIGCGAKVGAGSVVMRSVPAHTTVAGYLAQVVGVPATREPSLEMSHHIGVEHRQPPAMLAAGGNLR